MKNLNFIDKLLYFVNSILAILLLFSFLLQFIKPSLFPYLSFMSLSVPILIIINLLFFIYWLVKLKKQFILSLFVLLIGYNQVLSFFKLSDNLERVSPDTISVMSYNVRLFNLYNWIDSDVENDIISFIGSQEPDVINMQEYRSTERFSLDNYQFQHSSLSDGKTSYGLATFSKLPIVNNNIGGLKLDGSTITSEASGTADQQATLTGQIAATVVQILPNGNLIVKGEKKLDLSEGSEVIRVAGIVRTEDVAPNGTVFSRRLANAQISYIGSGELNSANRVPWGASLLFQLWPF